MDRPRRSVEQIEVIEHRIIEEGRRPAGSGARYDRTADEILDRYRNTGETDVSREPSFIHTSANYGQQLELSPIRAVLNTSTGSGPHRVEFADNSGNTVLNNYGYDVHEVHTSDGGARIVETHGGGPLHETSRLESTRIDEVVERPGITSALRSGAVGGMSRTTDERARREVFTVTSTSPPRNLNDSWRNMPSDSESFVRQDSYKRMQRSDELMGSTTESAKAYAPRSQTSLVSRSTRNSPPSEGCWSRFRSWCLDFYNYLRTAEWTPRMMMNCFCILFLLLLLLILLIIMLRALFVRYAVSEFLIYPPVCEECRRKNPNLVSAAMPSSVYIHEYSSEQAHFELRGNPPFKSNSFTAIDFSTGYVATADHALTDAQGRHFACFLKPLDKNAIPSMDALMEAVGESDSEIQSTFGWQEFWQFEAEEMSPSVAKSKFSSPIKDCENAKWYLLKQKVHARDLSCSECYDFCLPDWAVVRKEKYEDESTIGVRRLDCFRLWVPQWNNFRATEDQTGGHWQYPLSSESTKRNSDGEWVSWIPTAPHRNRRTVLSPKS